MKLMLDSSFLIGLFIQNDQWHPKSMLMGNIIDNNETHITGAVLNETLNALTETDGKKLYMIFEKLIKTNKISIVKNIDTYTEIADICLNYDSSIGYADCSILYFMEKNNITHILSFDEHFDKASNVVRIHEKNYKNFE